MVELTGMPPGFARRRLLPGVCLWWPARTGAHHLSFRIRVPKLVELTGFEPATYGLQSRRSPN
jgi:hypothetical protein